MGIFDKFKKAEAPSRPDDIKVEAVPANIYAPTTGQVINMEDVSDPVFSSGAMGKGVVIKPEIDTIYSPVDGEVTVTTGTLHALGLMGDNGVEILIHVGIDTVEMRGDGFTGFVNKGDRVKAGQALMTFDCSKIIAAGKQDDVIMVVTNTTDLPKVEPVSPQHINAGEVAVVVTQ